MSKGTITVLGHQVEQESREDGDIDTDDIAEMITAGDTEGSLYVQGWAGGIPIGTWKIINPWKEIAHLMYEDLKYGVTREELQNTLSAYEKLKEDENTGQM